MTSTATSTTTLATTAISTRATTASRSRARRNAPRAEWGARAIVLLAGGTAFLFAGSYPSTLILPAFLCLSLTILYHPWSRRSDTPALDWTLFLIGALLLLQLLPLPAVIVDRLSPGGRQAWQSLSLGTVQGALPLSIDLSSTVWALGIYAGALALFFVTREVFAAGGVRIVARGIATVGLVLSAECLAQDATAHGLIYWRWTPPFQVAPPFGPFLNRNHFATWALLAVPVTFGYLLAHTAAHGQRRKAGVDWHQALLEALDARSIWLAASICLMLVGLAASLSRSGMAGLTVALVLATFLRGRRADAPASRWAVAALALAALAAVIRIDPLELYHRFGTAGSAAAGRLEVWRATFPVVKDFWLTGTGAGTFETAMLVYQRAPSLFRINAAHNHYLQIAAEGGVLIGVPVAAALILFVRAALRALADDDSGMYLLRIGAFSALAGVAVQSFWETGLTTPANALLAAVLSAIVVHRSSRPVRVAD